MYRVSIDVGGTFTDCIVLDSAGALRQFKAPTTPEDPSRGLTDALARAADGHGEDLATFLGEVELIIQGTTLATNTLINRNGAKTGFITTAGFRDIIEMRRGFKNVRTSMYNVFVPPYRPLVERYLRLEAEERMTYAGEVHTPLNETDVEAAAARLRDQGIEAVAIGFLHSYANPTHEERASELTRAAMPDAYVTSSHEILPVWREYERFSTTVVSAYCGPVVESYLRSLEARLREAGFRGKHLLMCSDGLVETIDYCIPRVVYLIGSGPAAAPAGALHVAGAAGGENILSVDMGGTSFDICMVRGGEIPTTTEGWVQDERVAIKMVDVHSGGAGGGSIAWIDQLGLLRVGPMSAGADPGPACYGRGGTQPTVTDADLVLGYLPADYFLGGEIALDRRRARTAIGSVAEPLGMEISGAAEAIFKTVNSFMADQITEVATTRGFDVRDFALVVGGGAGPVHGAFIADLLHIPTILVPPIASTYSAFGMFAMDVGRNYARSYITRVDRLDVARVKDLYEEMEREALTGLSELGVAADLVRFSRSADLRYVGQFHEVEVDVPLGDLTDRSIEESVENFHRRHEALYTFNMPWQAAELLTFRLRATVPKAAFELRRIGEGSEDASPALKRTRLARFDGAELEVPVYDGEALRAGNRLAGPAIIEETTTTVVVPPLYALHVDPLKNYVMRRADTARVEGELARAFVTGGSR